MLSFLSARNPSQTSPLASDDLQPQDEIAGIAIAQHLHAAGVGRQIAADHA